MQITESETSQRSKETAEDLGNWLEELQSLTITDCSWEILDSFRKNIKKRFAKNQREIHCMKET